MSDAQPLVYPLILKSTLSVTESEPIIKSATDLNARRVAADAKLARRENRDVDANLGPAVEWTLVQRSIGFDVSWYVVKLNDLETSVTDAKDKAKSLWDTLKLDSRQLAKIIQLDKYDEKSVGPAVILAGNRFVGMLEPVLHASVRGGTERNASFAGAAKVAPNPAGKTAATPALTQQAAPPGSQTRSHLGQSAKPPTRSEAPGGSTTFSAAHAFLLQANTYVNVPRLVLPSEKFSVEVGLAAAPVEGVEGGKAVVAFGALELTVALDIQIDCAGFTRDKKAIEQLIVSRSDPFAKRVKFWLTAEALPVNANEDLRAIHIRLSRSGIVCGTATVRILVQRTKAAVAIPPNTNAPPVTTINSTTPNIDLTLSAVWQGDNEASHTLCWSYASPHKFDAPKGKMVRSSTDLASMAIGIVDELAAADTHDGIELAVGGIAASIKNEIPAGVFEVLASVTKAVRAARGDLAIPTLLLLTQEARVPWELSLLPDEQVVNADAPFLNTHFIVSRWLLDDNVRALPPSDSVAQDFAAIFGEYSNSDLTALPYAQKEAAALQKHQAHTFAATRKEIVDILSNKAQTEEGKDLAPGVIHFSGHGEANRTNAASANLMLNDGTPLSMTLFLNAPALKKFHPLVFLNACQLGAGTTSLGQSGGFASFCVRAQCSAVVAPLWSVDDEVAYDVSTKFYDDVLSDAGKQGISVAEAMFNSRQKPFTAITTTNAKGETSTYVTATRLAYLVYGHPAFRP
ncbi:MAG: CHAT domain-containing protein [Gemmatimonadaceae bacterium]